MEISEPWMKVRVEWAIPLKDTKFFTILVPQACLEKYASKSVMKEWGKLGVSIAMKEASQSRKVHWYGNWKVIQKKQVKAERQQLRSNTEEASQSLKVHSCGNWEVIWKKQVKAERLIGAAIER